MRKTLKISEPKDLLGYLPYHLGFHPQESVVALSVRGGTRSYLGLTMRIDIADLVDLEPGADPYQSLRLHMEGDDAQAVILVIYTSTNPARVEPATNTTPHTRAQVRELVSVLIARLAPHLPIKDVLIVTPEHYFSVQGGNYPPPDQWSAAAELEAAPAAVSAVYSGVAVAENRAALGEVPRAQPRDRDRAQRATLRWLQRQKIDGDSAWQLETWELWEEAITQQLRAMSAKARKAKSQPYPAHEPLLLGRLQAGLEDIRIRDAVMISCIPGIGDLPGRSVASDAREEVGKSIDLILDPCVAVSPGARARAIGEILRAIYAHCAANRGGPTLTLLAWLAWWSGDGARAAVLAEKALAADPAYNMARLVDRMLELGMPPGWVRRERELAEVG